MPGCNPHPLAGRRRGGAVTRRGGEERACQIHVTSLSFRRLNTFYNGMTSFAANQKPPATQTWLVLDAAAASRLPEAR